MEASVTLTDAIRQSVDGALSERFGGQVRITKTQNFRYSNVFRCTLQSNGNVPETVIVRIPREETARAGRAGLGSERAALEYLSAIGNTLAPRYFAGSAEAGFLVTEDLGPWPSLLDVLLGKNAEAARQGIVAFARSLGMLHAQTAGDRSEEHQTALPVMGVPVAEHWRQVRDAVAHLGLPAPQGVDGDIDAIARLLNEPGDCLALSSGDISVVNCKIISDSDAREPTANSSIVRFFDFEEACFRHALADAAVLRFPYPTGGPPWRVPQEIALQVETAYRTELAKSCPIAEDGNLYERGMAAACAAWAIIRLARLPRVDAGPDRDPWLLLPSNWSAPTPTRSRRRQLIAILEMCIESVQRAGEFEALGGWCELLADALRERWPEAEEELASYPAFS